MTIFISLVSIAISFYISYIITYNYSSKIVSKFTRNKWPIRILSFLAGAYTGLGIFKVLSYYLLYFIVDDYRWYHYQDDKELLISSFFLGVIFPIIIVGFGVFILYLVNKIFGFLPQEVDESLYLEFTNEAKSSLRRESLWAKCLIINDGDEKKALSSYVKERIKEYKTSQKKARETIDEMQHPSKVNESTTKLPRPSISSNQILILFYILGLCLLIFIAVSKFSR